MSELSELRAHNAALVDRLREAVDWVEKLNADNKRKTAYVEDAMGELRTAIKNAEAATTDVDACFRCPLWNGEYSTCQVAHSEGETHTDDTNPPDWCPLRKAPVTIRLVTK